MDTSRDPPSPLPHPPSVLVLLATHNGAPWVAQQIKSILRQQGIRPDILVSDDHSTDNTLEIIRSICPKAQILPPLPSRMGNACQNFLHLIRTAKTKQHDFIALSDQDDIWLENKLQRAVTLLKETGADAYSGNVVAFWENGAHRMIRKSAPQRPFDFLFESPGPGCTFVMPRAAFLAFQHWVETAPLQGIRAHDWLIYAFVRHGGGQWVIDPQPQMYYRQHNHNEIGANIGFRAALSRLKTLFSGQFRQDVLAMGQAVGHNAFPIPPLRRFHWIDRFHLLIRYREFRRDRWQALLLGVLFLLMKKQEKAENLIA